MNDYGKCKEKWLAIAMIGMIGMLIDLVLMTKVEEGTSVAVIVAIVGIIFIIMMITGTIKYNIILRDEKKYAAYKNKNDNIKEDIAINATNSKIEVECPYCHSTNTRKITGVSKAGSVALWGIFAAGKVSKQWHCSNCKSDF